MGIEERIRFILRRPTEEVVTLERLKQILEKKQPLHYIGFEISGLMHIGTGLMTALKVKDFEKAGIKTIIFLADYHSWINKKLGGDLDFIREVAKKYFIEMFKAFGLENTRYVLASEIYDQEYWKLVLQIGNSVTLSRVKRTLTIMGRKESESNPASWIIYPLMQAADAFKLGVDIMHAGMDQRKVHMLAIDVAEKIGKEKPVAIHTHLLPSLKAVGRMDPLEAKMSKSKPEGAIFIHDSPEKIREKLKKAVCPARQLENNPVYEILKWVIARDDNYVIKIDRDEKFGGLWEGTLKEFEQDYTAGKIHPLDLKDFVASWLIEQLKPAREAYEKHRDIVAEIEKRITR